MQFSTLMAHKNIFSLKYSEIRGSITFNGVSTHIYLRQSLFFLSLFLLFVPFFFFFFFYLMKCRFFYVVKYVIHPLPGALEGLSRFHDCDLFWVSSYLGPVFYS